MKNDFLKFEEIKDDEEKETGVLWFATTKKFTKKINSKEFHFSGLDFKILFYILNKMDYSNKIEDFYNQDLVKFFEKSPQSISTSVSKLRRFGFLKRTKVPYEIMINPEFFYTGTNAERKRKIIEYKKL